MQTRKLFIIIGLSLITLVFFFTLTKGPPDVDRKYALAKIDEQIKNGASSLACKQPKLEIFSPEMMKFVHEVPPIDCSSAGPDWVKCEGATCNIQDVVRSKFGPIRCIFTDLIRVNDFQSTEGDSKYSYTSYKLRKSDVVKVYCTSSNAKWSAVLTGIRYDPDVLARPLNFPPKATKFNVLMVGFDSLSRNTFVRKLPKSYKYLINELQGEVLQGYNIVGDGTPQALIPLLTGKTELELPDTRKRIQKAQYVNSYPFIWNEFRNAGYVTGFYEDVAELSTFTYRLKGFNEVPTDHYMRPYYLAALSEKNKWPKLCTGDTPRHKIMLNHIKNFFSVYKNKQKFLFGFHGELSHDDYNLIGAADEDFYDFLKELKTGGFLNDTILIVMADHGHRFASIRNTIQGKQEERLPFFSFTFPEAFKQKFPLAHENFRTNLDKLTTPFDIHKTLQAVLNLDNVQVADISERAVSLFAKIPPERSCAHAYIEPHWCACLDWTDVPLTSDLAVRIADALVDTLNKYTVTHRYLCSVLTLSKIDWLKRLAPNSNLMAFQKSSDFDGFQADLSAKMELKTVLYQIKLITVPGNGMFEASITHLVDSDTFSVALGDISRTNLYGRQARCVENDFPHLRKYCYCK